MTDDLLVRYAESDGATVAWSAVGTGPALVVTGWWCSHLALNWADPLFRDYIERLADHHTVIRYGRVPPGAPRRRSTPRATSNAWSGSCCAAATPAARTSHRPRSGTR